MNTRYDKDDDVLMVWFTKKPVEYAEQTGDIIMHFTKDNHPVLMEILNASAFLMHTSQALPAGLRQRIFA